MFFSDDGNVNQQFDDPLYAAFSDDNQLPLGEDEGSHHLDQGAALQAFQEHLPSGVDHGNESAVLPNQFRLDDDEGPDRTISANAILSQNALSMNIETTNKAVPSSDGAISKKSNAAKQTDSEITYVVETPRIAASTETRPLASAVAGPVAQPVTHPIDNGAMRLESIVAEPHLSELVNASHMDLGQNDTQKRVLKTSSEPTDHLDESLPKRPRLDLAVDVRELEEALLKARTLQASITSTMKCFIDNVGDEFTKPVCNAEKQELNEYEGRSKIVVPEFADSSLQALMCYPQRDLKQIQDLIAQPVLNKVTLVTTIEKSLKGWKAIFKGRTIPERVAELMSELSDLKRNLSNKEEHAIGFCVSNLRSDKEHIREQLKIGQKSRQSVALGFSSLKDYSTSWDQLQTEVGKRKKQQLTEIEELEKALSLARSRLFAEEVYETRICDLHGQYIDMLNETSNAMSAFEDFLTQGESCLVSINAVLREIGSHGDSALPIRLRQQLKFVESCVIEGNDGNDQSDEDDE